MCGQHPRPPCDHLRVTEGDDLGRTPTSTPRAEPIVYEKKPESKAFKVVSGVFIAVTVIVVVVVVGFALTIYNSFGGWATQPTDRAVRLARMNADPIARSDVDVIVKQLSPVLGPPGKQALIDTCWDSYGSWSFNNAITCGRSFYLYYPLPTKTPVASNLSQLLTATKWRPDPYGQCTDAEGITMSCLSESDSVVRMQVNSAPVRQYDRYPAVEGYVMPVEMDGYRELTFAASKGPCVVVLYTYTYYRE